MSLPRAACLTLRPLSAHRISFSRSPTLSIRNLSWIAAHTCRTKMTGVRRSSRIAAATAKPSGPQLSESLPRHRGRSQQSVRTGTIKAAARPDVRARNSSREPVDSTLSSTAAAKKKPKVVKASAKAGPTKALEMELWGKGCMLIAGTDEAGRGPLAGPVVAAACCIPQGVVIEGVADRHVVDARTIDEVNILQAAMLAMETSVGKLPGKPDFVLVDGNRLPKGLDPERSRAVVKGDDTCYCIAAASVIAKVTRDRMILEYDTKWPQYDFKNNKGYGTVKHMAAIRAHGAVEIHRRTFAPLKHMDLSHLPPP